MFYILENTPLADKGQDVRRVDCFIQRMDPHPVGKNRAFLILIGQRENFIPRIGIYPLKKLSTLRKIGPNFLFPVTADYNDYRLVFAWVAST